MKVGFVGLGNIGSHCARHILAAGHELTVYDLDKDARARLVEAGANEAANAAGVSASSEAVLLSLPSPDASRAVVTAKDGILLADSPASVVVDLSTNSSGVTEELFEACASLCSRRGRLHRLSGVGRQRGGRSGSPHPYALRQ